MIICTTSVFAAIKNHIQLQQFSSLDRKKRREAMIAKINGYNLQKNPFFAKSGIAKVNFYGGIIFPDGGIATSEGIRKFRKGIEPGELIFVIGTRSGLVVCMHKIKIPETRDYPVLLQTAVA